MAITVGVTGAIFAMVNPGQGAFRVQPEVADLQQRLRVAASLLNRDLMMAGAGMYSGAAVGPLMQYFPPVVPYRIGKRASDAASERPFRRDAITIIYIPDTAAQTTTRDAISERRARIRIALEPGCPASDRRCGFAVGDTAVVFDESGSVDTFRITAARGETLQIERQGERISKSYAPGAYVARAETHTYYLDATTDQLMHYDGWDTETPLVDDVVGLRFRYFGSPEPPTSPRPAVGVESCLFTRSGRPRLRRLGRRGSLVELSRRRLRNGPWCGDDNPFDADLYRIRSIRVEVRIQAGSPDLRGADPTFFRRPGSAARGSQLVRDFQMSLDVSPRNLSLGR